MELREQVKHFLHHPFPLWETTLTQQLVQYKWKELEAAGFRSSENYSTAGFWLHDPLQEIERKLIPGSDLMVEMPSTRMQSFYNEHGLELLTKEEIESTSAVQKLGGAISILRLIEPAYDCIVSLVKSVHVLRSSDADIDLSYSHPNIPFSIFISLCEDDSTISNLRVAESILHEAMHLKLTLIENLDPLVKDSSQLYFSPWKNESRPIQGVLHGLFVFRAISDFYKALNQSIGNKYTYFVIDRIETIRNEINLLNELSHHPKLTPAGNDFVMRLFEY